MMIVRLIQNLSYLRQRESQLPGLTGKPKPSKILGIELLVVVVRVTGRFEQVLAGVKPDRIRVYASSFCKLFYLHRLVPLHLRAIARNTSRKLAE